MSENIKQLFEGVELSKEFKEKTASIFRRYIQKCVDAKKRILQKDFDLLIDSLKKGDEYSEDNLKQLKYEYNQIVKNKIDEKSKNKKKDPSDNSENEKVILPENKNKGIENGITESKTGEKIYKFKL
ncbi:hypothetical protein [Pseudoalteromonas sp. JC3]|uniref:hypothetical protein n=1 Tax=Pseudoalteromonas sp. JC3 TaxID=2810196 RepID=UPI0019CFD313|nr:hypothetical protein [Pseudoalteromonas sp. JC3]MBR8841676.1 hypothetical protein [Pseudoalteromonas sp. JC3]WJE07701.1 hypothetical protein QSH61_12450 [Pseudoalteromonas sp. JC3]